MTPSSRNDRPSKHAHWLVADTAKAMAHELYDTLMQDNRWYDVWKKQNPGLNAEALASAFVDKNLPALLPQARATLAQMLANSTDERLKETIYESLLLDGTLIRGRPN